jgi:hypothetical protein
MRIVYDVKHAPLQIEILDPTVPTRHPTQGLASGHDV